MKGSKKQFSRFLESECNDDYLEPLEDDKDYLSEVSKKTQANPQRTLDTFNTSLKPSNNAPTYPITIYTMKTRLMEDVKHSIRNVQDAVLIESNCMLKVFNNLYSHFETVPVLFLSYLAGKAVYLWQINRKCPINTKQHNSIIKTFIGLDTNDLGSKVGLEESFLLVAKIVPEEGEDIIGAQLIEDHQLYVRSRKESDQLVIRAYNIVDFHKKARVNPWNPEIVANNLHSFTIVIKQIEGSYEVSLWRKTDVEKPEQGELEEKNERQEEILVGKSVCEGIDQTFGINRVNSCKVYKLSDGVMAIFAERASFVVAWKRNKVSSTYYENISVKSIDQTPTSLIIKDEKLIYYKVTFEGFPVIDIDNIGIKIRHEEVNGIQEVKKKRESNKKLVTSFSGECRLYPEFTIEVYQSNLVLMNPQMVIQRTPQLSKKKERESEIQQEKKEEEEKKSLAQKIQDLKNSFLFESKQISDIEKKDLLLKEIRQHIGSEGKSDQALILYQEIKNDKRVIEKERERRKSLK